MVDRLKPTMSLLEELERELRIDDNVLEDVCREHPVLLYRVGKQVALVVSRRDAAKLDLKRVEAQTSIYMREVAKSDKKMTIDEAKARLQEDPEYLAAVEKLQRWQDEVGSWSALQDAFAQRSYALNHLVDLYLARVGGSYIERRENSDERTRNAEIAEKRMSEMRRDAAARGDRYGRDDRTKE